MKKSLKGAEMVYQIRTTDGNDNTLVGTRHWMLRVQFVSDSLRKDLANVGLFQDGAISDNRVLDNPPNVEKIFPANLDGYQELTRTPYLRKIGKDIIARVFLLPDGTNYLINDTYVTDIETQFQATKNSPLFSWSTKGGVNPAIYGGRLALVLPYRAEKDFQLRTMSYTESGAI